MLHKRLLLPLLLLLAALASGRALAMPPTLLGFDDGSCLAWVKSKEDPERRREYVSWARGFVSGHNYANQRQQVTDVSRSTVENYIERFCRDKPKAQFTEAASRMSDEYSGRGTPISK